MQFQNKKNQCTYTNFAKSPANQSTRIQHTILTGLNWPLTNQLHQEKPFLTQSKLIIQKLETILLHQGYLSSTKKSN